MSAAESKDIPEAEFLERLHHAVATEHGEQAYLKLRDLCTTFGARPGGSVIYEAAVDWLLAEMQQDGLEHVRGEEVPDTPRWVRGQESCQLLTPRPKRLDILGIGSSIATPPEGITASVVCVTDFEDISNQGEAGKLRNKIVLINVPFTTYNAAVQYRTNGASRCARYGALAVLVRSVAPFSLYTPHTGTLFYEDSYQIPAACVTSEDAELLSRLLSDGADVTVCLKMEAATVGMVTTRNVVAEWRGWEKPDEVVVVAAHLDSWDVGDGAHDDGQGCIIAWACLRVLKALAYRCRRTVRVVLFSDEENRQSGSKAYLKQHQDSVSKHVAAIETDMGCWPAIGFGFTGSAQARQQLAHLASRLTLCGATTIKGSGDGLDIVPLIEHGVPGLLLRLEDEWWRRHYFWYHHTNADTFDKINPAHVVQNLQAMVSMVYLLADMEGTLDRVAISPPANDDIRSC